MSLAEAAVSGPPRRERPASKIDIWLASLEPSEREGAVAILENPEWDSMAVRRLFARHGVEVAYSTIVRYREGRAGVAG